MTWRWRLGALVVAGGLLGGLGCKRARPAQKPRAPASAPARLGPVANRQLTAQCELFAAPARGKQKQAEVALATLPPRAGQKGADPATRRLAALEAIDRLEERRRNDPKNPDLYFQLGWIYRWSLENRMAAARYLCRALLLRPSKRRFRWAVLSNWMQPGSEPQLELSLRVGERNLAWKGALAQVRRTRGLDDLAAARLFEDSIASQRLVRNNRLLKRRRARGKALDLQALVARWLAEAAQSEPPLVVVSFPRRWRGAVGALQDRARTGNPEEVFGGVGPERRWLVFSQSDSAVEAVTRYVAKALPGKRVGVSVKAAGRRLYIVGVFVPEGFRLRQVAASPESSCIRELDLGF